MSAYPPGQDPNQPQGGVPSFGAPPPPPGGGYTAPPSFGAPPTGGSPAGTYKPAKKGMSPWAWCGIILLVLLCCCCGSCAVAGKQIAEGMRGLGGPFEDIGDAMGDAMRQMDNSSGDSSEDFFSEFEEALDSVDSGPADGDDGWESPMDSPGATGPSGDSSDGGSSDSGSTDTASSGGDSGAPLGTWKPRSLDSYMIDAFTEQINDSESKGEGMTADAIRIGTWLADISAAGDQYTTGNGSTSDGSATIIYTITSGPIAGEYIHGFNSDYTQYVPISDNMKQLFREMNFAGVR